MTALATLDRINDFPGLVRYLRDALEWEIPEDAAFGDLTFNWTPSEIGLDLDEPIEITQLRPLRADQPWGVFFLNFPHGKLPVTLMRRILRGLSKRKRASANAADRAAWDKDDLIFISAVGDADDRRLSFAHFQERGNDLPTLRVIGWDKDDTVRRLSHTDQVLRSKLGWRYGEGLPVDWRDAFTERPRESVRTAKEMAEALAALARDIRDRIKLILPKEKANGDLKQLFEAVNQTLSRDLDVDKFADTYAQTIAYGLLSARINQVRERDEKHKAAQKTALGPKPELPEITADAAGQAMPTTNPFLKELFGSFLSAGGRDANGTGLDFDELGVGEVVDLLNVADMEAVLLDFDKHKTGDDPVIHFYEGFLHAYDKALKVQRGVFYTPRPVVSFIVRSVDDVLRTEFGLADGLADVTTWDQFIATNPDAQLPSGMNGDEPFVKILDPATGTGTFLVEVIDLIHATMTAKWRAAGIAGKALVEAWNDYVPKHLLPRLYGFELMMAPYAVAHMKLGLKLADTGYRFEGIDADGKPARARVFLTNALEPARDLGNELEFMSEALAHEAKATNVVKDLGGFTVVIGNPPYSNYSSNLSAHDRSLVDKYRTFRGSIIRERNQLQFERNIQDDYIKFISTAESSIEISGLGVLGFITNATSLSSPSLRGMRERLLKSFSALRVFHLHGGVNETSDSSSLDQNVFDIAQAVAIHVYVDKKMPSNGDVTYSEIWGTRESKYETLLGGGFQSIPHVPVIPDVENCTFTPQTVSSDVITFRFNEVFQHFGGGIKTNRDDVAIGFTSRECLKSAGKFLQGAGGGFVADATAIHDILYRPLDFRKIYYDDKLVKSRSFPTMQNFVGHKNIGIIASSSWTSPERFSVGVSNRLVEMKAGTHDRGTTLFPLYRFESILSGPAIAVSNFSKTFSDAWLSATGRRIQGDTLSPEMRAECLLVMHWIYAVCHSTGYRESYRSSISQGFPLVCLPRDSFDLQDIARCGAELVALHLLDPIAAPILADPKVRFVNPDGVEARLDGRKLDMRRNTAGRVYINDACWFETVPASVWGHWMGGYQPAQKWLKDRAAKGGKNKSEGRILTLEDQLHYRRMITALSRTAELMAEIDDVIAKHGGWPDAFKGMTD